MTLLDVRLPMYGWLTKHNAPMLLESTLLLQLRGSCGDAYMTYRNPEPLQSTPDAASFP